MCGSQVNRNNKMKLAVKTKIRGTSPTRHESSKTQSLSSNDSVFISTSTGITSKPRKRLKKAEQKQIKPMTPSYSQISRRDESISTKSRVSIGSDVLSRLMN
jgi:hypothetical protein